MDRRLSSLPLYGYLASATPATAAVAGAAAVFGERGLDLGWRASRLWARGLLQSAGMTALDVRGFQPVEAGGPWILMANHQSHLDPPAVIAASRRPLSFLAKAELFRWPVFGWAMRRVGHIPIDRGCHAEAVRRVDEAAELVARGRVVAVFPEGTRSRTPELQPFKKGGFVIAIKSGAPIVPIGVAGTRRILPPGFWVDVPSRVVVRAGEPIATRGRALADKEALMDEVRAQILALRAEARAIARAE